nr:peptidoglycan bridge formation glycyltransferase FemA/FemB family protein [Kocuria sediminis]
MGWRYLHCPHGPDVNTVEEFDAALADLRQIARTENCWFIRVEPPLGSGLSRARESTQEALRHRGLRRAPHDALPEYTQIIDLTRDENDILQDMDGHNRKRYRNIHKKGVTFTDSTDPKDIELLIPILDAIAQRHGYVRKQNDYLRTVAQVLMPFGVARLYIAWLAEKVLEVTLVYDWEGTRIQAYGGMDYEHRKLNAGNAQTVRMILEAKKLGLAQFDLGGIAPEDAGPDHPWSGFTKFKKSFGGRSESCLGSWDLPIHRLRYAIFPSLFAVRYRYALVRSKVAHLLTRTTRATGF